MKINKFIHFLGLFIYFSFFIHMAYGTPKYIICPIDNENDKIKLTKIFKSYGKKTPDPFSLVWRYDKDAARIMSLGINGAPVFLDNYLHNITTYVRYCRPHTLPRLQRGSMRGLNDIWTLITPVEEGKPTWKLSITRDKHDYPKEKDMYINFELNCNEVDESALNPPLYETTENSSKLEIKQSSDNNVCDFINNE